MTLWMNKEQKAKFKKGSLYVKAPTKLLFPCQKNLSLKHQIFNITHYKTGFNVLDNRVIWILTPLLGLTRYGISPNKV